MLFHPIKRVKQQTRITIKQKTTKLFTNAKKSADARKGEAVNLNIKELEDIKYQKKNSGKKVVINIVIYFYIILMLLVLLTVASYTWFSLSKTPRVSSLSMHVTTAPGLELSLDPDSEEWGSSVSYTDMVKESSPLRPITWADRDQKFYAAVYGIDGRLTDKWFPLSDERNANRNDHEGYYCIGTLYARASDDIKVSLNPAVEADEGKAGAGTYLVGTPIWNSDEIIHNDGGMGAETAVRVGIKVTRLDENSENSGEVLFFIYEPNSDTHADGSRGYVSTPSIDGSDGLVPEENLITQTTSSWIETDPVQNGVVFYRLGDFTSKTELFSMKKEEKVMIQIYIWLEGQDVDCTNEIKEAQIIANIQFGAISDNHSGLTPIE